MIRTYNIGSLAATLKLAAIRALSGELIAEGLTWILAPVGTHSTLKTDTPYTSDQAQPYFTQTAGTYAVSCEWKGNTYTFGDVLLEKNTQLDVVYWINTMEPGSGEEAYYADPASELEYERQKSNRRGQSTFGTAEFAVRDPDPVQPDGCLDNSIPAHPLLSNEAQFDGVEPNMTIEPSENRQSVEMTLQHQLQQQPSPSNLPKPGFS